MPGSICLTPVYATQNITYLVNIMRCASKSMSQNLFMLTRKSRSGNSVVSVFQTLSLICQIVTLNIVNGSVDELVEAYNSGITSVVDRHAPVCTKCITLRPTIIDNQDRQNGLKARGTREPQAKGKTG
jgi:hypothetical protein